MIFGHFNHLSLSFGIVAAFNQRMEHTSFQISRITLEHLLVHLFLLLIHHALKRIENLGQVIVVHLMVYPSIKEDHFKSSKAFALDLVLSFVNERQDILYFIL